MSLPEFEREWRRRFEKFARQYQKEHLISGWSEQGLRRRLEVVRGLLDSRGLRGPLHALDLGCGGGTYVRLLSSRGFKVVGADYSRPSLERAVAAGGPAGASYLQGEAYHLPFRDAAFDLVLGIGIFQALGQPERALDEIRRVLRPGGFALVEALNADELLLQFRRLVRRAETRQDPVRVYPPRLFDRWLATRGLRRVMRAGLYLPPRSPAWAAPLLDRTRALRLVARTPVLASLAAHAYLTLAVKDGP